MAKTLEELLSGDFAGYTSPEDAAGMNFAGMNFAGFDPNGVPLFADAAGNYWPADAAGMNFAGMNFAGAALPFRMPVRPAPRPAPMNPQQMYQQQLQQQLALKAAQQTASTTPVIVPGNPGTTARTGFSFDSTTTVAAGASTTITVQPQMPMKIDRLSTANTSFLIDDFKIGTKSQFAAIGSFPSEAFAPNAVRNDVTFDPVLNGYQTSVRITNVGGSAARFVLSCFGEVIRS
jgi:hypothetical protein